MGYMCKGFASESFEDGELQVEKFLQEMKGKKAQEYGGENPWLPCFASVNVSKPLPKGYTIVFNISYDYSTEYIDSPDFVERVENWIALGKSMGLAFDKLQYKLIKSNWKDVWKYGAWDYYMSDDLKNSKPLNRTLMFYIPLDKIKERNKLLHAHLFFLRYLYEKHATIDFFYELRSWVGKDYPWISDLGMLILAETCSKLVNEPKGTAAFRHGAHHFLSRKSLECVLLTAKKIGRGNLFTYASKVLNSFDDTLIGKYRPYCGKIDVKGAHEKIYEDTHSKASFLSGLNILDSIYKERLEALGSKD